MTETKGWAHPHLPNEGKTSEWYTPPLVFDALNLLFSIDVAAPSLPAADWVPALQRYTIADDGLAQPWRGRVWCNPPYGKATGAWVERLAEHGWGVALVFARTDVRWWHKAVKGRADILLIEKRLTFGAGAGQSAPGNSGGPSVLLAYGEDCSEALRRSGLGDFRPRG